MLCTSHRKVYALSIEQKYGIKQRLTLNGVKVTMVKNDDGNDYAYKMRVVGGSNLDYCRIFSRSRYVNDTSGYRKKSDKILVLKQAQIYFHKQKMKERQANRDRVCVRVHKNMISVKVKSVVQGLQYGGGIRGKVAGFSPESRKRMIELMNKQRDGSPKTFVTLTYADEALFYPNGNRLTKPTDWKNHLEMLRKRIERRFPELQGLWRIELKERKSGGFRGKIAPHYHLLVWGMSPDYRLSKKMTFGKWLRTAWFRILRTGLKKHYEHGTHVSSVKSTRHAMFYVSKYVAKMEDEFDDSYMVGRRWGRIGKFNTDESAEFEMSERELVHFRRLLSSWMKSRGFDYAKFLRKGSLDKGFSVFACGDQLMIDGAFIRIPLAIQMIMHIQDLIYHEEEIDTT